MHFYQILANECRIDHRIVSSAYGLVQLVLSGVTIALWDKMNFFLLVAIVLVPLSLLYMLKFRLIKKYMVANMKNQALVQPNVVEYIPLKKAEMSDSPVEQESLHSSGKNE